MSKSEPSGLRLQGPHRGGPRLRTDHRHRSHPGNTADAQPGLQPRRTPPTPPRTPTPPTPPRTPTPPRAAGSPRSAHRRAGARFGTRRSGGAASISGHGWGDGCWPQHRVEAPVGQSRKPQHTPTHHSTRPDTAPAPPPPTPTPAPPPPTPAHQTPIPSLTQTSHRSSTPFVCALVRAAGARFGTRIRRRSVDFGTWVGRWLSTASKRRSVTAAMSRRRPRIDRRAAFLTASGSMSAITTRTCDHREATAIPIGP